MRAKAGGEAITRLWAAQMWRGPQRWKTEWGRWVAAHRARYAGQGAGGWAGGDDLRKAGWQGGRVAGWQGGRVRCGLRRDSPTRLDSRQVHSGVGGDVCYVL